MRSAHAALAHALSQPSPRPPLPPSLTLPHSPSASFSKLFTWSSGAMPPRRAVLLDGRRRGGRPTADPLKPPNGDWPTGGSVRILRGRGGASSCSSRDVSPSEVLKVLCSTAELSFAGRLLLRKTGRTGNAAADMAGVVLGCRLAATLGGAGAPPKASGVAAIGGAAAGAASSSSSQSIAGVAAAKERSREIERA